MLTKKEIIKIIDEAKHNNSFYHGLTIIGEEIKLVGGLAGRGYDFIDINTIYQFLKSRNNGYWVGVITDSYILPLCEIHYNDTDFFDHAIRYLPTNYNMSYNEFMLKVKLKEFING